MAVNPFDFINSINNHENIMTDEYMEKAYNPFITNRQLSYFNDTALIANEMNQRHYLDKKLQYEFFINTIRKRKRFTKWSKPEENDNLEMICNYFGCNYEKGKQILAILTSSQIELIKEKSYKGGISNDKQSSRGKTKKRR